MGNILKAFFGIKKNSVHPHVRGEHNGPVKARYFVNGSSPRTWGTSALEALARNLQRFIPTYVGNITG
ncbi:hypothetical protein PITCH_A140004 [uncultured Desulfobacterium sp.]|uniref:Uncharacterized protein n=1 Tax=uncultured Desulfobacterium sp. TaxID=201089 RepID=A0A445MSM9_9BACT|nr:hypothetical protein PITCH_A140004 [uncultured Desulfobacterium sp.]